MKIACLTQRPIQTIILMYLIGRKKIKFSSIFFTNLKQKDKSNKNEDRRILDSLKFQCELSNIPLHILESPNDMNISKYVKKYNLRYMISLVGDTIISKNILDLFDGGVYGTHNGILPNFRGIDANKWSFLYEKKVGISLLKLKNGVDDGDIIKVKSFKIKSKKADFKKINEKIFYRYKLNLLSNLIDDLNKKKPLVFITQKKKFKQYFAMHKDLFHIIKR